MASSQPQVASVAGVVANGVFLDVFLAVTAADLQVSGNKINPPLLLLAHLICWPDLPPPSLLRQIWPLTFLLHRFSPPLPPVLCSRRFCGLGLKTCNSASDPTSTTSSSPGFWLGASSNSDDDYQIILWAPSVCLLYGLVGPSSNVALVHGPSIRV